MRTTTRIKTNLNDVELKDKLNGIFKAYDFKLVNYKGNITWKKGSGWITAPQIFQIRREENVIIIDSWMPFALLPGIYIGESGLESAFGFVVKISMRCILKQIIQLIQDPNTTVEGYLPK